MSGAFMRVKICGITNEEDALAAIEAGANALGFNAWRGSNRFVDLEREGPWIGNLPPFVSRIAVVVNPSVERADAIARLPFIDAVQFHGDETSDFCVAFARNGFAFLKALAVRGETDLDRPERFGTRTLLLDAHAPGTYGGTGRVIDWELASEFVQARPDLRVVLSGGLTPENVAEAVRTVRPFAVDVASGVEATPRTKDRGLMRAFICAARSAD